MESNEVFKMNTQTQEALKMAIKALQNISKSLTEKQVWFSSDVYDAMQACKEALEQPAQEPVAWMHYKDFTIVMHDVWEELLDGKNDWYPLYMEQSQS